MNPVYAALGTTIFEHVSARARASGAINLGQGFPDAPGPADVVAVAARALVEGSNQYPPMAGLLVLRDAIAAHYVAHQRLDLDASEVIVTSGATEAIAAAILALVSDGDEVVMFEPLYDAYLPMVRRAGGVPRIVRRQPPEWRITADMLAEVGSVRTRLVIVNDPINPVGAMLSAEDRRALSEFCIAHDAVALCDEVWEHVVLSKRVHVPLMTEPGMRARTVKIGSAGKIFAMTGWKVGWMCAAPALAAQLAKAHQFLTFTTPPNLQAAVAYGLGKERGWFDDQRAQFRRSRDRLREGLVAQGYVLLPGDATWFVTLDLAASGIAMPDTAWNDWLIDACGVAAIPLSAFYAGDAPTHLVRLCYCKNDDVLDDAVRRMGARP